MSLEDALHVSPEAAAKRGFPPDLSFGNINIDPLTGLPKGKVFLEDLANYISVCKQAKRRFGLIYFNVNRFRLYNHVKGHISGDYLLIEICKTVQAILSDSETFYRCGGDRFVILVKTEYKEDILQLTLNILSKIRQILIEPFLHHLYQQKYVVFDSVSAGASVAFFPENVGDAKATLDSLEYSAFLAKRDGEGLRLVDAKYSSIDE